MRDSLGGLGPGACHINILGQRVAVRSQRPRKHQGEDLRVRGRGKGPGSEIVSRAESWVVRCRVREHEGPRAWTASDAERGPRSRASGAGRRRTVGAARNSPARRTGVPRDSESESRVEVLLGKELVGQGLGPWLAAPAPHSAPLPAAPQSAQCPLPVPAACSSSSSRFLLRSRSPMAGQEVSAGLSPATSVLSTPGRPWPGVSLAAGEGFTSL